MRAIAPFVLVVALLIFWALVIAPSVGAPG